MVQGHKENLPKVLKTKRKGTGKKKKKKLLVIKAHSVDMIIMKKICACPQSFKNHF